MPKTLSLQCWRKMYSLDAIVNTNHDSFTDNYINFNAAEICQGTVKI